MSLVAQDVEMTLLGGGLAQRFYVLLCHVKQSAVVWVHKISPMGWSGLSFLAGYRGLRDTDTHLTKAFLFQNLTLIRKLP